MIPAIVLALAMTAAPVRPALAPGAESTSLVLIIANNRSAQLGRPPLQYADDDGAKYHQVLSALAGADNTVLLTDFDRDTARLFPALARVARGPTRANVDAAVQRLAGKAAEAKRAGRPVLFYFVFAGHGDVDQGRGFLELTDGPFTADDLDASLARVGGSEAHVILDSCNSFFVVNPRKPGGRRFATPRDALENLARRLPDVGVFLSTSAEANVYEWSELQSGVFSHAVRSGLLGAADADQDGQVSYRELAGFVETAAAEIKNPLFRPRIFVRGPAGQDDRALFALSRAYPSLLTVSDRKAVRLAVRDREGLRWLDAHKEAGAKLDLRFPRSLAGPLEVELLEAAGPVAGTVKARYVLPAEASTPVALAGLAPAAPAPGPRGPGDIFRALFTRPFGPAALAAYQNEHARQSGPVFGISREEAQRMGLLLEQLSASAHDKRVTTGAAALVTGAAVATYSGLSLRDASDETPYLAAGSILSALYIGVGVYRLAHVPDREKLYERFRARMETPGADQARIAADTEAQLLAISEEERRERRKVAVAGWVAAGLSAGLLALNEWVFDRSRDERNVDRLLNGAVLATSVAVAIDAQFTTSPTEKMIALWQRDPDRARMPGLSLAPVPGGAMLALRREF